VSIMVYSNVKLTPYFKFPVYNLLFKQCAWSCYVIGKGGMTIESLLNGKELREYPLDEILEALAPVYNSKHAQAFIKDYVKKHFKNELVLKGKFY